MEELDKKFFCYQEKPLVRSGNTLYFGSMLNDYVIMMQIMGSGEQCGIPMASKIDVKLMRTAKNISPKDMIVKSAEKPNLYQALDIASIWLDRALAE